MLGKLRYALQGTSISILCKKLFRVLAGNIVKSYIVAMDTLTHTVRLLAGWSNPCQTIQVQRNPPKSSAVHAARNMSQSANFKQRMAVTFVRGSAWDDTSITRCMGNPVLQRYLKISTKTNTGTPIELPCLKCKPSRFTRIT